MVVEVKFLLDISEDKSNLNERELIHQLKSLINDHIPEEIYTENSEGEEIEVSLEVINPWEKVEVNIKD